MRADSSLGSHDDAHQQGLEALVELAEGALKQLRNGLNVIKIDVDSGSQLVRDNADLLSRTLAQIAPKLLAMPQEITETPKNALIDIDAVTAALGAMKRLEENGVCPDCGQTQSKSPSSRAVERAW